MEPRLCTDINLGGMCRQPTFPHFQKPLFFFGHSHESGLYHQQKKLPIRIRYGQPIALQDKQYGVNVGSVINHREWCLYDSQKRTVTFMCVPPINL